MPLSLYDATVPTFRQVLGAVGGLVETAERWAGEQGLAADDITGARLAPDMLPFATQIKFTRTHSLTAIEQAKLGLASPDMTPAPVYFPGLKALVADTIAALEAMPAADVDAMEGRDMLFELRGTKMPFTADQFLLSFSQPNFHFHATTAYAILRMKGVPLGKRDYLGQLRLKM
jgi:hypothetical protein